MASCRLNTACNLQFILSTIVGMQADVFRKQINELKRKLDAVKTASADLPVDPQVMSEDGKTSPAKEENGPCPTKRHKGGKESRGRKESRGSKESSSKLKEAVLKVVKQRLDGELKRGGITQEEYKDIAKRATNKVIAKRLQESVRCLPVCELLPVHNCYVGITSSAVVMQESNSAHLSSGREKKIQSLVSEYVSQAKKRRDL